MGGMQRVSMQLVDELANMKHIELKTITLHAKWKHIGIKTTGFLIKLARQLPHIAKDWNADVILFSSMVTASLAPFLKNKLAIPMITINHGQDVTMPVKVYQSYLPKVFKALSGVISVSQATLQECLNRGMSPQKGIALPNGFPMEWLNNLVERSKAKSFLQTKFSIPENSPILLTVGRMVKRKGHAWFASEVLPKLDDNYRWLIIGDGAEYPEIERRIKAKKIEHKVIFAGRQPDSVLYNAYSGADLFIMPNIPVAGDMEGFGIVLLEAGLAGTPSIASDLEGIKDVIEQGVNGFKLKPLAADEFISTIQNVMNGRIELLRKSTKNYVLNNFGWKHISQQYVDFIQEVLKQNVKLTAE